MLSTFFSAQASMSWWRLIRSQEELSAVLPSSDVVKNAERSSLTGSSQGLAQSLARYDAESSKKIVSAQNGVEKSRKGRKLEGSSEPFTA